MTSTECHHEEARRQSKTRFWFVSVRPSVSPSVRPPPDRSQSSTPEDPESTDIPKPFKPASWWPFQLGSLRHTHQSTRSRIRDLLVLADSMLTGKPFPRLKRTWRNISRTRRRRRQRRRQEQNNQTQQHRQEERFELLTKMKQDLVFNQRH